jgi:hypothetical protein
MVSQVVASDSVEHADAEEGGADQQVDDVKHWKCSLFPGNCVQVANRRILVAAVQR